MRTWVGEAILERKARRHIYQVESQRPKRNTKKEFCVKYGEIATHSSILAWKITWTEEPGGLQSMGVTKHWTRLHTHTRVHAHVHTHTQGDKHPFSLIFSLPFPPVTPRHPANSQGSKCLLGHSSGEAALQEWSLELSLP